MSLTYCPLYSGSSGNSALLASEKSKLLIDAGLAGKTITDALQIVGVDPHSIKGILITHEHTDHIKAAGILSRKYDLPIFANARTWDAMIKFVGNVQAKHIRIFETGRDFYVGDIEILPYPISHDAADPVGFCFQCKGRKLAQMTDLGHISAQTMDIASGSDLVLIESNHDIRMLENGSYPMRLKKRIRSNHGHLSNEQAAKACVELARNGVRRFILGHLSGENNTEELAFRTVSNAMTESGMAIGQDFDLYMAHRDRCTGVFTLK